MLYPLSYRRIVARVYRRDGRRSRRSWDPLCWHAGLDPPPRGSSVEGRLDAYGDVCGEWKHHIKGLYKVWRGAPNARVKGCAVSRMC